jgi:tetratricopeptide (TPR) repeat protein
VTLSSNNRAAWWGEAWAIFRADPVLGAGANTFAVARLRHRGDSLEALQPHSVPLQELADGGLVGLALLASAVAAAAGVCVCARRRLEGGERAAASALAAVALAWLVHALADYPLDFVAVTAPVVFALGVLATAGRPVAARRSPPAALAAGALALAAIAVLLAPRLAAWEVDRAYAALDRGDREAALRHASRARALDPFSLEPYYAEAEASGSRAPLRRAAERQPENPEPWARLGTAEFAAGNLCEAYAALNEAYTRDPFGAEPGGLLDRARAYVEAHGCG